MQGTMCASCESSSESWSLLLRRFQAKQQADHVICSCWLGTDYGSADGKWQAVETSVLQEAVPLTTVAGLGQVDGRRHRSGCRQGPRPAGLGEGEKVHLNVRR